MSRGVWIRFILVLGLLAGCAALAINVKPNLGLDLKGGAQFVFEAQGTAQTPANAENVDKTLQVLRGRVDALGVAESTLVRQGSNRILVELPGVTSDKQAQEAEDRIGTTAKLTVHEVLATAEAGAKPSKKGNEVLPSDQGDTLEVGPTVIQGEEMISPSRTIAMRRLGSPLGLQAALPVMSAHFLPPSLLKSIATTQSTLC